MVALTVSLRDGIASSDRDLKGAIWIAFRIALQLSNPLFF